MSIVESEDYIAIDTNVFLHLTNPQNNGDSHIDGLLKTLKELKVMLLVDDKDRLAGEYKLHLAPKIRNADETDNKILILRYWFIYALRHKVDLELQDRLMQTIRGVIHELPKNADRIFVYVAFKEGKILISNDKHDIVCGPVRERRQGPRRTRLLNATRNHRPNGADILTSREASSTIST